jgi:hypothetical protein
MQNKSALDMKEAYSYKVQQEANFILFLSASPRFGHNSLEGFVKRHHKKKVSH